MEWFQRAWPGFLSNEIKLEEALRKTVNAFQLQVIIHLGYQPKLIEVISPKTCIVWTLDPQHQLLLSADLSSLCANLDVSNLIGTILNMAKRPKGDLHEAEILS